MGVCTYVHGLVHGQQLNYRMADVTKNLVLRVCFFLLCVACSKGLSIYKVC